MKISNILLALSMLVVGSLANLSFTTADGRTFLLIEGDTVNECNARLACYDNGGSLADVTIGDVRAINRNIGRKEVWINSWNSDGYGNTCIVYQSGTVTTRTGGCNYKAYTLCSIPGTFNPDRTRPGTIVATVDNIMTDLTVNWASQSLGPNAGEWTRVDYFKDLCLRPGDRVEIFGQDQGVIAGMLATVTDIYGRTFSTNRHWICRTEGLAYQVATEYAAFDDVTEIWGSITTFPEVPEFRNAPQTPFWIASSPNPINQRFSCSFEIPSLN